MQRDVDRREPIPPVSPDGFYAKMTILAARGIVYRAMIHRTLH
jgi:hypothetical protein